MKFFLHLLFGTPCWEMVLHGPLTFLYISWAEALAAFVLNYLLEDFCMVKSFERYCICLWEQRPYLLTVLGAKVRQACCPHIMKDSGSLSLRFCGNAPHCVCRLLPSSLCITVGEHANMLATGPWIIKPIVSDTGVSCLLSASVTFSRLTW